MDWEHEKADQLPCEPVAPTYPQIAVNIGTTGRARSCDRR